MEMRRSIPTRWNIPQPVWFSRRGLAALPLAFALVRREAAAAKLARLDLDADGDHPSRAGIGTPVARVVRLTSEISSRLGSSRIFSHLQKCSAIFRNLQRPSVIFRNVQ
jgi:hypothetical protein